MASEVRLTGIENEPLGVVSITEALRMAGELDVDLVEIAATANPPVCRLIDYGKLKYQQPKQAAEAKSKQKVCPLYTTYAADKKKRYRLRGIQIC